LIRQSRTGTKAPKNQEYASGVQVQIKLINTFLGARKVSKEHALKMNC
jgi:hypothetical protein